MTEIATNNETINDIFKPSRFLSSGNCGNLYSGMIIISSVFCNKLIIELFAGTLLYPKNKIEIAMKFTHIDDGAVAEHEYEMYSYLNAIDNPMIERYGIPSVHYYGSWKCYILLGITLLDAQFNQNFRNRDFNELDILILCKEFVSLFNESFPHNVFDKQLIFS